MKIATSILNAKDRIECTKKLNNTNNSYIHVDVMDGIFVPNEQMNNINEIKEISKASKKPLDIHLMVSDPIKYIEKINNFNAEYITFHIEIENNIEEIIKKIKSKGYKVGISIKPNTDISLIEKYLQNIDLVLIMSVEPGLGGQKFITNTTERINELKKVIIANKLSVNIEVDGGINNETIKLINNADIAVVGTYIINSDNYNDTINNLIK